MITDFILNTSQINIMQSVKTILLSKTPTLKDISEMSISGICTGVSFVLLNHWAMRNELRKFVEETRQREAEIMQAQIRELMTKKK